MTVSNSKPTYSPRYIVTRFSMSWVVRHAGQTIRGHIIPLIVVSIALNAIPAAAQHWLTNIHFSESRRPVHIMVLLVSSLASAIPGSLFSAWVVLLEANDRINNSGDDLSKQLRRVFSSALPIAILTSMYVIGVSFSSILLIVPGLILATFWSLSLPALVIEGLSPRQALKKSSALTKNHRWAIFVLMASIWIPTIIMNSTVTKAFSGGLKMKAANNIPLMAYIVHPLIWAAFAIISSAFISSIYMQLAPSYENEFSLEDVFS